MRIAITAAEASGDRVAGQLAESLKRLAPDVELYGTGGKWLRAGGAEVIVDASQWGVIGVAAALKLLPKMLAARRRLLTELRRRPPDVLVPIDAGAFHLGFGPVTGLCPWVRKALPKTKIVYYFPPGSWRKTLRYTPLAGLVDAVASPFPWNAAELNRLGVPTTFVGHPLLDLVKPVQSLDAFAKRYGLDTDKPIIGLLPGSRQQELETLLPVLLAAALLIAKRLPGVQFLIALAPTIDRAQIEAALQHLAPIPQKARRKPTPSSHEPLLIPAEGSLDELERRQRHWIENAKTQESDRAVTPPFVLVEDATYDVLAASDALICKSGTTTIEAAILTKPMVIVYKVATSWLNQLQYALVKKNLPRFVGMPNLIAGTEICRELIQEAATPEAIADEILGLLLDPDRMGRMRRDLHQVRDTLGEPGGAERTARLILEQAGYRLRESA